MYNLGSKSNTLGARAQNVYGASAAGPLPAKNAHKNKSSQKERGKSMASFDKR